MEITKARNKIHEIVLENKYMFEIPIKEVGADVRKFCEENNIKPLNQKMKNLQ